MFELLLCGPANLENLVWLIVNLISMQFLIPHYSHIKIDAKRIRSNTSMS